MTTPLDARDLGRRFGSVPALDGFDLSVGAGEIAGLIGHNGAGKTTFARAVAGLLRLDRGEVRLAGVPVAPGGRATHHLLGLAPQELALYPTATARENLLLFGGLYGLRQAEARRRAQEMAEAMVLGDVLDRRVRDLSGGMQRRLQAATAMLHRPPVLLLDEPTVGADPRTREALLAAVRRAADDGAAVVYTTHYLPELDVLDATLALADHGRIVARGTRAELLGTLPGRAVLAFDGPAPGADLGPGAAVERDGSELTITAADPSRALASAMADPRIAGAVRSVEVRPPSLDDLYRHLLVDAG